MITIQTLKTGSAITLRVLGILDGSAAWRLVRLTARLARGRHILIDLAGVDRILGFGASVLARGLAQAAASLVGIRPEHRRLLLAEGLLSDDNTLSATPAA